MDSPSLGEGSQSRRRGRGEGDFGIVTLIMFSYLAGVQRFDPKP
jgi:hypothetical protein